MLTLRRGGVRVPCVAFNVPFDDAPVRTRAFDGSEIDLPRFRDASRQRGGFDTRGGRFSLRRPQAFQVLQRQAYGLFCRFRGARISFGGVDGLLPQPEERQWPCLPQRSPSFPQ